MSEEVMERLAAALENLGRPIPVEVDLWDMGMIAKYLKRNPQVVRERMACLSSFPKAIRIPTSTGRAQPLYRASEVMKWAHSYQEKH